MPVPSVRAAMLAVATLVTGLFVTASPTDPVAAATAAPTAASSAVITPAARPSATSAPGTVWTTVPSAAAGTDDHLYGVACGDATSCFAVGEYYGGSGYQTLIEAWTGGAWTVVPSPDEGYDDDLQGVACSGPSWCVAVGTANLGGYLNSPEAALIETWDGTAWSIASDPDPQTYDHLDGVSCAGPTACVAVGQSDVGAWNGPTTTLVETWDGAAWTASSAADPGTADNSLDAVSCVGGSWCTAVGSTSDDGATWGTLAETWNGTAWSVDGAPDAGFAFLNGVACTSTTDCVAVGYANGPVSTVIESFDGTAWTTVASPDEGYGSILDAVSCPSASRCVAVGSYDNAESLIESSSGAAWTITPTPDPSSQVYLSAMTCPSTAFCVAAGDFYQGSTYDPLVVASALSITPDTALAGGASVKVTAAAGSFAPGSSVSVAECDPAVSGGAITPTACGRAKSVKAKADGSVAKVSLKLTTGPIGSDPSSGCPPAPTQVDATGSGCVVTLSDGGNVSLSGAVWFAATTTVAPGSAAPGTAVSLSGGGLDPGETVVNRYVTKVHHPPSATVCTATVGPDGTWSCSGDLPAGKAAGKAGHHAIVGTGSISHDTTSGTVDLS